MLNMMNFYMKYGIIYTYNNLKKEIFKWMK